MRRAVGAEVVVAGFGVAGARGFGGGDAAPAGRGRNLPTGAAAAPQVFDSRSTKIEKSEVKVTFDQLPAGTSVKQDRAAKGTDIEYTGLALGGAL